jgi:hypothetical protein
MMDLKALQGSPSEFRRHLLIDTDNGAVPFSSVIDPWQSVDFEALDAGWQRAAGQRVTGDYFWFIRLMRT